MARPVEEDLARLVRALEGLGIRNFALTGGAAYGVWVEPRETRDLDVCAELPQAALMPLLAHFDGMRFGASEVPDIVRFRIGDWDVDLFVAKYPDDFECLARAVPVALGSATVRIVTAEDLMVHKLRKLRSDRRRVLQDAADLRTIFAQKSDLDWSYVQSHLGPDDLALLDSIRRLSDDEFLERLKR
jgi:hypothetical protein